jgi:hypothetical protein
MSKAFFNALGKKWAMTLENKFGDSCVFIKKLWTNGEVSLCLPG